ncbi:MAG: hypothetical protein KIT80_11340 [Chitinophagaceae bacterium]|nr:hypothetical protein [Chitinophagaceae bacterium]MCW5927495.1 hypothetical protein [Chitinophagaceae bacterium]
MPYDFTYRRVIILDNQTALERNISLATELTNSFTEISDENSPDSNYYFTKTLLDTNKEFPELHFYLKADIEGFIYYFSFRKDYLNVELGAGGDVVERFRHLQDYSKIILSHNFQIEDPLDGKLVLQDIGFKRHIEEYKKWVDYVDYVRRLNESPR